MASVAAILGAEQGAYEWPGRNCITTALALYRALAETPRPEVMAAWQEAAALSEKRAWAKVLAEGGPLAHHRALLGEQMQQVEELEPGALVFFHGTISVGGDYFHARPSEEGMGFCDESYTVLHWAPIGLRPVRSPYPPHSIWRIA
ncbi:MAG: hypothetical protein OXF51_05785 [Alphaproteobacteria bacterium]|nr:hypothetical protein [Alphaproteobacteria bacterium]